MKPHYPFYFLLAFLLLSCSHKIKRLHLNVVPPGPTATIQLPTAKQKSFDVLYLGCGHMIIKQNNEAFFLDPFFSIQPIIKLPVGKLKTKKKYYQCWRDTIQKKMDFESVQSGLVSHSHYDHLMDLPWMIRKKDFPNLKTVYGNAYLPRMLKNFRDEGVFLDALTDCDVFNPCADYPVDQLYAWKKLTDHSNFLPIQTHHAPQALGKLFMSGKFKEKKFVNHLKNEKDGVGNFKWTVGTSYAFLIDLFSGTDTVRIYIQTSASSGPKHGLPPAAELAKKKVDLMILCYASTSGVDDYPRYLIDKMRDNEKDTYPKIMMVHWEDFFKSKKTPKLVALTSPRKTKEAWMNALDTEENIKKYITMPKPGTLVTVKY